VNEVAGRSYRLPSGPLHDAAEMARSMPTVMLFVKSLKGLSHTREEDTPEEDLELSVQALHRLALKTINWAANAYQPPAKQKADEPAIERSQVGARRVRGHGGE